MLLALLFVSTAVATPLLGTEQCARGPPYWCQNVKTASLCGAVPHCQQNVWSQPQMKSVPCDLCKEVMVVVDQLLKDNSTEAELLGYMEKTCQLIPDEGVAAECKEMVDDYYPVLMGIIKGELEDPGVVCGALGLCVTQQEALAKAQLMSNEIPQVDLTQRISPMLLNIPQLLYPGEMTNKEETETPKEAAGDVCGSCVQFITDIQNEAKTNASFVNSLIAEVESQCDLLGPDLSDMCKQYVSEYAPLIIQQLMSMQPKDICSRAGFCSSVPESVPMQTLVAAKSIPLVKTVPATMVKATLLKPAKKMVRAREPPQCAICEFVMREVEGMIQDHTTEEEVVQAVEKVCNILPSTLTAQCKDLIETYGQAIIELLVQEADPKTVCALLGLCNGAGRNFVSLMEKAEFEAGGFCDVCKMAVRYVDAILEKNATQAEIEEAVKKVCNFLPDEYKTQCDQLVEQYEPLLVELLLQTLDPDFVCMKLGACPEVVQKLLGLEQCSWGPSFWCKNVETASLCNAVDHCKRHVWS